jgi:hypothetical protein
MKLILPSLRTPRFDKSSCTLVLFKKFDLATTTNFIHDVTGTSRLQSILLLLLSSSNCTDSTFPPTAQHSCTQITPFVFLPAPELPRVAFPLQHPIFGRGSILSYSSQVLLSLYQLECEFKMMSRSGRSLSKVSYLSIPFIHHPFSLVHRKCIASCG